MTLPLFTPVAPMMLSAVKCLTQVNATLEVAREPEWSVLIVNLSQLRQRDSETIRLENA
jgi:hypothetical protein